MTKLDVVEKAIRKGIEKTGKKKLITLFNEYLELVEDKIREERVESYDEGYEDAGYLMEAEQGWYESLKT